MRTVSIFKNDNNRAIHLPRNPDFDGVNEPEIIRNGVCYTLLEVTFTRGKGRCGLFDKARKNIVGEKERQSVGAGNRNGTGRPGS